MKEFSTSDRPLTFAALQRDQRNIATTRQLLRAGVPRGRIHRFVKVKGWTRLSKGIYCLSSSTPDARQWAIAAALRAEEWKVPYGIGGLSAAQAYGLTIRREAKPTVWAPRGRQFAGLPGCRIREDGQERLSRARRDRWPNLTSPEDTVVDLAAELDGFDLAAILASAVQTGLVTHSSLLTVLTPRRRGSEFLLELLEDSHGLDSILEVVLARCVFEPHALPTPVRQARITRHSIADALIDEYALIIEADGASYHDAEADAVRDAEHSRLGFVTLRFGYHRLIDDPCSVAREIADALAERGWPGSLRACPRCPDPQR